MNEPLNEWDLPKRVGPWEETEDLSDGVHGQKHVYLEGAQNVHIGTGAVKDPPSVIVQPIPPIILTPAPVTVGKGYLAAVAVMFLIVAGSQALAALRDGQREAQRQAEIGKIDAKLGELNSEIQRLRTPPVFANDTENGALPVTPPKRNP